MVKGKAGEHHDSHACSEVAAIRGDKELEEHAHRRADHMVVAFREEFLDLRWNQGAKLPLKSEMG